jgi:hypothetical protein
MKFGKEIDHKYDYKHRVNANKNMASMRIKHGAKANKKCVNANKTWRQSE